MLQNMVQSGSTLFRFKVSQRIYENDGDVRNKLYLYINTYNCKLIGGWLTASTNTTCGSGFPSQRSGSNINGFGM